MSHNKNVLEVAKAIQYFQKPFSVDTIASELQGYLRVLEGLFDQEDVLEKSTANFIVSIYTLLIQRYYQLGNSKEEVIKEQFLLVKFVKMLFKISKIAIQKQKAMKKQLIVIGLWATVSLTKSTFQRRDGNTDIKSVLLQLNDMLVSSVLVRGDFRIEQIYPKEYSLCSGLITKQKINVKQFSLCMQSMQLLILHNPSLQNWKDQGKFGLECCRRLLQDIKYFIDRYFNMQLGYQKRVEEFSGVLMKILPVDDQQNQVIDSILSLQKSANTVRNQLFSHTVLLAQICMIDIPLSRFDRYRQKLICQSYRNLLHSTCKSIKSLQANRQSKVRELNKLANLCTYIKLNEGDQIFEAFVKGINYLLTIKHTHQLISIPNHATTIPIQKINSNHSLSNYPIKALFAQYKNQFRRILVEIVPFYQLQPDLVCSVQLLFSKLTSHNFDVLLRFFCDQLLKYDYQVNMSLTKLYQYLQILFVLRFLLNSTTQVTNLHIISTIFIILADKTESIKSLKASYIEEELLISMTLQIAFLCFRVLRLNNRQGDIRGKIKLSQNSVYMLQKVLNQLSEQSYIIRLITTYILLQFAQQNAISQAIRPYQATIILRNKNNLSLIFNLLAISHLLESDCQQLADYYMRYRGSEVILGLLLLRVSIETARKCILTVQRWWLLLTRQVIQYLNCREMDNAKNKQDNFASNDGENVSIKNALGVIIIQLGQKWVFYLRSQKRESVVDILNNLLQTNSKMVFFRSGFSKILKEIYNILAQTLGKPKMENDQIKIQKSCLQMESGKIQFYNRLRFKIYRIIDLIQKQCFALYDRQIVDMLLSIIEEQFTEVKREYLFQNNTEQKPLYDLLKRITQKLQQ